MQSGNRERSYWTKLKKSKFVYPNCAFVGLLLLWTDGEQQSLSTEICQTSSNRFCCTSATAQARLTRHTLVLCLHIWAILCPPCYTFVFYIWCFVTRGAWYLCAVLGHCVGYGARNCRHCSFCRRPRRRRCCQCQCANQVFKPGSVCAGKRTRSSTRRDQQCESARRLRRSRGYVCDVCAWIWWCVCVYVCLQSS